MTSSNDVVITGTGLVTPIGIGREAFLSSLRQRQSGAGMLEEFAGADPDCVFRIGARIEDFEGKKYVQPRKAIKAMCREVQTGFAAAHLAVEEAGLEEGSVAPERMGVIYGSELLYCGLDEMEEVYRNCLVDGQYQHDLWGERAMADIFPLWMLKHLPNMPACQVGISLQACGPNNTICHEDVSSNLALIEAANYISRGAADVMIAGGTSSRLNISKQIYRDSSLLSRRLDEPERASRPFDAGRDGMVAGEGAAALVLESRGHAESRGAKILAQIAGYARTCMTKADASISSAIGRSMETAIRASQLDRSDLAYVSAFATSTVEDDAMEARAIHEVLGDIPVTALKSYLGFIGAGAGAVELAAAALALETGEAPVTLNYERPDESCPVNVIGDQALRIEKPAVLIAGNSFGGQAVSIILKSP